MHKYFCFCLFILTRAFGAGPSIILVMTDDQGYGDLSITGNPWIETPDMDRLVNEGARFERFFVQPSCATTRAALLSGRYRATETTLHDLIADPGQENNLAKTRPEIHADLLETNRAWAAESTEKAPSLLPIQIGYEEWPTVEVKAHEMDIFPGMGEGINYSGRQGFAHQWIESWSDPKAYAAFPIKVISGERYRVLLRYACPEDAVGSVFRLNAGNASLDIGIQESWVSAPHGAAEQVIKNQGAYLSRDWKDLDAGELALEQGTHSLELRLVKKAGVEMPDIKAVFFERLKS